MTTWTTCVEKVFLVLGAYQENFSEGAKSFFLIFFPAWDALFPVENFHFGTPKTNFSHFQKRKAKKKKKKKKKRSSPHFAIFIENWKAKKKNKQTKGLFPPSIFNFPSFLLPFSIFSFPLFPGRSAGISQSEVSGGHSAPPACYTTVKLVLIVGWILGIR